MIENFCGLLACRCGMEELVNRRVGLCMGVVDERHPQVCIYYRLECTILHLILLLSFYIAFSINFLILIFLIVFLHFFLFFFYDIQRLFGLFYNFFGIGIN